jgi:hypothetical protein
VIAVTALSVPRPAWTGAARGARRTAVAIATRTVTNSAKPCAAAPCAPSAGWAISGSAIMIQPVACITSAIANRRRQVAMESPEGSCARNVRARIATATTTRPVRTIPGSRVASGVSAVAIAATATVRTRW